MNENQTVEWTETMQRLHAVADVLQQAADQIAQQNVGRIVATVDTAREAELERRLAEAEAQIAEAEAKIAGLTAAAAAPAGRKTLPAGMATLLAKQGVALEAGGTFASMEAAAIDSALASLSVEQRIAVKSELLRAGLLG